MVLEHLAEMSKDDAEYLRETIEQKRKWEDRARKEELEEKAWTQGMEEGESKKRPRNCFEYVAKRSRCFFDFRSDRTICCRD